MPCPLCRGPMNPLQDRACQRALAVVPCAAFAVADEPSTGIGRVGSLASEPSAGIGVPILPARLVRGVFRSCLGDARLRAMLARGALELLERNCLPRASRLCWWRELWSLVEARLLWSQLFSSSWAAVCSKQLMSCCDCSARKLL